MVTQPAANVSCSQFHGWASCRELSPLLCSVPIHIIHNLGSKSHCWVFFFFSPLLASSFTAPLHMASSSLSLCLLDLPLNLTEIFFSLPCTELLVAVLSLHWVEQECSLPADSKLLYRHSTSIIICSLACKTSSLLWHSERQPQTCLCLPKLWRSWRLHIPLMSPLLSF